MTDKQITTTSAITAQPNYPALELDMSLYQDILDDPSILDDQKQELIETLWAIAVACVDMGLGLHPLQQACGQFEVYNEVPNMVPTDVVECKHTTKPEFEAVNPAINLDSKANKIRKEKENHDTSV